MLSQFLVLSSNLVSYIQAVVRREFDLDLARAHCLPLLVLLTNVGVAVLASDIAVQGCSIEQVVGSLFLDEVY